MQLHWDIFCRVIDNYGDIGICWRLARQLVMEHGRRVRLWVDDLGSLKPLCPEIDPGKDRQRVQGIEICLWHEAAAAVDHPGEVIIEAFACELPAAFQAAMAQSVQKPCWINLEYLTAETWAEDCHGLASPHPTLPLTKYFFFPGFSRRTGGLLREARLLAIRDCYQQQLQPADALEISLFCYETAPVAALLAALAKSPIPVICHVPPGKPLAAVKKNLDGTGPWQLGKARIQPIPFLALDDYDRLLWRCSLNFVRGEDSFVRAEWAARPFVWQVYQQEQDAHLEKLAAFLDCYCAAMPAALAVIVRDMFTAWNTGAGLDAAWQEFVGRRSEIAAYNRQWADHLADVDDLAAGLVKFCASKV